MSQSRDIATEREPVANSHKLYDKSERSQWTLDLSEQQQNKQASNRVKPQIRAESVDCEDVPMGGSEDRDSMRNLKDDINSTTSAQRLEGMPRTTHEEQVKGEHGGRNEPKIVQKKKGEKQEAVYGQTQLGLQKAQSQRKGAQATIESFKNSTPPISSRAANLNDLVPAKILNIKTAKNAGRETNDPLSPEKRGTGKRKFTGEVLVDGFQVNAQRYPDNYDMILHKVQLEQQARQQMSEDLKLAEYHHKQQRRMPKTTSQFFNARRLNENKKWQKEKELQIMKENQAIDDMNKMVVINQLYASPARVPGVESSSINVWTTGQDGAGREGAGAVEEWPADEIESPDTMKGGEFGLFQDQGEQADFASIRNSQDGESGHLGTQPTQPDQRSPQKGGAQAATRSSQRQVEVSVTPGEETQQNTQEQEDATAPHLQTRKQQLNEYFNEDNINQINQILNQERLSTNAATQGLQEHSKHSGSHNPIDYLAPQAQRGSVPNNRQNFHDKTISAQYSESFHQPSMTGTYDNIPEHQQMQQMRSQNQVQDTNISMDPARLYMTQHPTINDPKAWNSGKSINSTFPNLYSSVDYVLSQKQLQNDEIKISQNMVNFDEAAQYNKHMQQQRMQAQMKESMKQYTRGGSRGLTQQQAVAQGARKDNQVIKSLLKDDQREIGYVNLQQEGLALQGAGRRAGHPDEYKKESAMASLKESSNEPLSTQYFRNGDGEQVKDGSKRLESPSRLVDVCNGVDTLNGSPSQQRASQRDGVKIIEGQLQQQLPVQQSKAYGQSFAPFFDMKLQNQQSAAWHDLNNEQQQLRQSLRVHQRSSTLKIKKQLSSVSDQQLVVARPEVVNITKVMKPQILQNQIKNQQHLYEPEYGQNPDKAVDHRNSQLESAGTATRANHKSSLVGRQLGPSDQRSSGTIINLAKRQQYNNQQAQALLLGGAKQPSIDEIIQDNQLVDNTKPIQQYFQTGMDWAKMPKTLPNQDSKTSFYQNNQKPAQSQGGFWNKQQQLRQGSKEDVREQQRAMSNYTYNNYNVGGRITNNTWQAANDKGLSRSRSGRETLSSLSKAQHQISKCCRSTNHGKRHFLKSVLKDFGCGNIQQSPLLARMSYSPGQHQHYEQEPYVDQNSVDTDRQKSTTQNEQDTRHKEFLQVETLQQINNKQELLDRIDSFEPKNKYHFINKEYSSNIEANFCELKNHLNNKEFLKHERTKQYQTRSKQAVNHVYVKNIKTLSGQYNLFKKEKLDDKALEKAGKTRIQDIIQPLGKMNSQEIIIGQAEGMSGSAFSHKQITQVRNQLQPQTSSLNRSFHQSSYQALSKQRHQQFSQSNMGGRQQYQRAVTSNQAHRQYAMASTNSAHGGGVGALQRTTTSLGRSATSTHKLDGLGTTSTVSVRRGLGSFKKALVIIKDEGIIPDQQSQNIITLPGFGTQVNLDLGVPYSLPQNDLLNKSRQDLYVTFEAGVNSTIADLQGSALNDSLSLGDLSPMKLKPVGLQKFDSNHLPRQNFDSHKQLAQISPIKIVQVHKATLDSDQKQTKKIKIDLVNQKVIHEKETPITPVDNGNQGNFLYKQYMSNYGTLKNNLTENSLGHGSLYKVMESSTRRESQIEKEKV